MIWNDHSNLKGKHSVLSPSQSSWLRYSDEDNYASLLRRCTAEYSATAGTVIHEYAQQRIKNKLPMSENEQNAIQLELIRNGIPTYAIDIYRFYQTLVEYVNDTIEYDMEPEVVLYYSDNAFGTTDAIKYYRRNLRIHDLKTGTKEASFDQLIVYAAYFFLEYGKKMKLKPESVDTELRIYQSSEISICHPDPADIYAAIDKIVELDPIIDIFKSGGVRNDRTI